MARITDATKVEVLRSLDIDEYQTRLSIARGGDGASTFYMSIADPRRQERNQTIAYINELRANVLDNDLNENTLVTIIAHLDEINETDVDKYGENKGQPVKHTITMYLDPDITTAIVNLLDTNQLDYSVSKTIRESLTVNDSNNTKGF
jgi:hypothetical protein